MEAPPAVTVVMPVYNVEAYVWAAVQSVLAQSFKDFELIVVDDGSLDTSIDIVKRFVDDRITIIRQANRGLAGARNTGIAAARGEFVAFLDSDDLWHPDKLMLHIAHLRASNVDVSCSGSLLIDDRGRLLGLRQAAFDRLAQPGDVFCGRVVRNGSVPVIRRAILEAVALPSPEPGRRQYFDEALRRSEDVECWTRLAVCAGARFGAVHRDLTYYRINNSGLSADIIRQLESWDVVCGKIEAYAPEFIRQFGGQARALELRYLARRSFHQRDRGLALRLAVNAIASWPALCLREPFKTLSTFAACVLLRTMPNRLFGAILAIMAPGFAGAR